MSASRRGALASVGIALLSRSAPGATLAADRAEWEAFKARFLQADGRIVDSGNRGVSHTEGQGWAMMFAEWMDDASTFQTVWGWTTRNLRRPRDNLHAWRFDPGAAAPVSDLNNATDGDLFICAALFRAARRWSRPDYAAAARGIAGDLLRLLVRRTGNYTVLLPGVQGFETATDLVLNPSYYVFPAMQELAAHSDAAAWRTLQRDGVLLLTRGRFGRWKLQPDWLQLSKRDGELAPAPSWPPRFSYDAVRVPLYLAWGGLMTEELAGSYRQYWTASPTMPAWVDLKTDETAPYAAPSGMVAVSTLLAVGKGVAVPASFPAIADAQDYYSAALTMLARNAWHDVGVRG